MLALAAAPVLAETPARKPVGIVVSISPYPGQTRPGTVVLKSPDGSERRLGEGEFVSENDEIVVNSRDTIVVISERRGNKTICAPQSSADACRLVLTSENSFLGSIGRFYDSILRITSRMTGNSSTFATLSSRAFDNSPPSMTINGSVPQELRAGQRALWLTWSGGTPPFRVELSWNSRVLSEQTTDAREVTLQSAELAPGYGSVSCRDANGQQFSIRLIASDDLPAAPDFSDSAPSVDVERFLAAAWLSQQDQGRFQFEAVQQLSPLARNLHVADTLRQGLMLVDPSRSPAR